MIFVVYGFRLPGYRYYRSVGGSGRLWHFRFHSLATVVHCRKELRSGSVIMGLGLVNLITDVSTLKHNYKIHTGFISE